MYPIDLLKVCSPPPTAAQLKRDLRADGFFFLLQTRMQVMNPTPAAIYTGLGNAIATISRVEGYMSLWRGLSSVVLGAGQFSVQTTKKE